MEQSQSQATGMNLGQTITDLESLVNAQHGLPPELRTRIVESASEELQMAIASIAEDESQGEWMIRRLTELGCL